MTEAPDLFEPVLGWRCWMVLGDRLRSVAVGHVWEPEETALCKRTTSPYDVIGPHAPPGECCFCGLYAYHEPWAAEKHRSHLDRMYSWQIVTGAVEMWGVMEVYGTGVRAEHARVLGLARPTADYRPAPGESLMLPPIGWRAPLSSSSADLVPLERVAERYGVPVLPMGQLIEYASKDRGAVPERLYPEGATPGRSELSGLSPPPPPPPPPAPPWKDLALPLATVLGSCVSIATGELLVVKLLWLVAVAFAVATFVMRVLAR